MSDEQSRRSGSSAVEGVERTVEWPASKRFYLTLDLECDFGTALERNTYQAVSEIDRLAALLEATSTPLTCFVQTDVLDVRPEAVETLRQCDVPVQFHPHSHNHRPRDQTVMREEVEVSTARFTDFFGTRPTGYRFPDGNLRDADYRVLASAGYQFDASVFPTWRPGQFNNVNVPRTPTYLERFDLFELPFTVLSPYAPIPTGLSYARVFGRLYTNSLLRFPPDPVVFNIHMHDLNTPPSAADLPRIYRAIYSRNDDGFKLLRRILAGFDRAGYSFDTMDDAHEELRELELSRSTPGT